MYGQYPYTRIEFELVKQGFNSLSYDTKMLINKKIESIINAKKEHFEKTPDKKFRYECPFLINNVCSVYPYRGLVCRAFGLMCFKPDSKEIPKVPFCAYEGLNYSNAIDIDKNNFPVEKFKSLGFKTEPKAYNIDYVTLIDDDFAKGFHFEFGEVKPLIDWIDQY